MTSFLMTTLYGSNFILSVFFGTDHISDFSKWWHIFLSDIVKMLFWPIIKGVTATNEKFRQFSYIINLKFLGIICKWIRLKIKENVRKTSYRIQAVSKKWRKEGENFAPSQIKVKTKDRHLAGLAKRSQINW